MKSSHYLAIAVRLFSIALFLLALRQTPVLFEVLIYGGINEMPASLFFIATTVLVPLIIAFLLWRLPLSVARSILPPETDNPVEPLDLASFLTVFLAVIGFIGCYYALTELVYWSVLFHLESSSQYFTPSLRLTDENKAEMAATVFELIVALILVLKARVISLKMLKIVG